SGNFIHKDFINSDSTQHDNIFDVMAFDTSRIYLTGNVQDSIKYNGEWFTSSGPPSNEVAYPYIAKISTSKADWIKLTHNKFSGQFNNTFFISGYGSRIISDKKGFVY